MPSLAVWRSCENPQARGPEQVASVARASIEQVRASTGRLPRMWPSHQGLPPLWLAVRNAQRHRDIPEPCWCLAGLPYRYNADSFGNFQTKSVRVFRAGGSASFKQGIHNLQAAQDGVLGATGSAGPCSIMLLRRSPVWKRAVTKKASVDGDLLPLGSVRSGTNLALWCFALLSRHL
jgi:hypothetical protein